MFGSTNILPPRTKRWAEAKVLADCINLKVLSFLLSRYSKILFLQICKLYLYNNEHALALSQHTIHTRRFSDFSRGWGIGEETFEFWSWIARQRVSLSCCPLHLLSLTVHEISRICRATRAGDRLDLNPPHP